VAREDEGQEVVSNEKPDLDAIEARTKAATPGPWKPDVCYVVGQVPEGRPGGEVIAHFGPTRADLRYAVPSMANVEFAAAAREDVPMLLAEVRRLLEVVQQAEKEAETAFRRAEQNYQRAVQLERQAAAMREALMSVEHFWTCDDAQHCADNIDRDDVLCEVRSALAPDAGRALLAELAALRDGRATRQGQIADWTVAAFGREEATGLPQRGVRLLEEAIEAYQATGGTVEMGHKLLDFVFARPVGSLHQEIGGVSVCLLALAAAAGLSADDEEAREVARVLAKPLAEFAARNRAKNEAGFRATEKTDA
jgi:hypothetical protein